MKYLIMLALSVFFIGFGLKFFHIHYNAVIMMGGIFLLLVISISSIIKKTNDSDPLIGFSVATWLIFLLFTVKYWPFSIIILSVAVILTVIAILRTLNRKVKKPLIILGFCATLSIVFYLMPTDSRYYMMSIKWNSEIETDFYSYDKYSWFLYQNGNYDEALIASNKAKVIVAKTGEKEWSKFIAEHNQKIRNKNWNHFR